MDSGKIVPDKLINKIDNSTLKKKVNSYNEAVTANKKSKTKTTAKNVENAIKSVEKASKKSKLKTGLTSKELKQIDSYMKSGKLIPDKLVNKDGISSSFQAKLLDYNQKVLANRAYKSAKTTANNDYKLSKEQTATEIRQKKLDEFNTIKEAYDSQIEIYEGYRDKLEKEVDLSEAKGNIVNSKLYTDQIAYYQKEKAIQEGALKDLQAQINAVEVGTDEWKQMYIDIQNAQNAVIQYDTLIVNLTKDVRTLSEEFHDLVQSTVSRISDEADFLVELMGQIDSFDEKTGAVTNEGIARLYSYVVGQETNKNNAESEQAIIDQIKKQLRENPNRSEFTITSEDGRTNTYSYDEIMMQNGKLQQSYDNLRDYIKKAYDYESKRVDWMKEKYQAELDALNELIDAKKKSLEAEKDLYSYQKTINDSTKNIDTIKKQIVALSGDTSQESRAKIQQLQQQLEESQQDLRDTEYDRYISDQEDMLDKLYEEYESLVNNIMKNPEKLLTEANKILGDNYRLVEKTFNEHAKKWDYDYESLSQVFAKNLPKDNTEKTQNTFLNALNQTIEEFKKWLNEHNPNDNTGANTDTPQQQQTDTPQQQQTATPVVDNTPTPPLYIEDPTQTEEQVLANQILGIENSLGNYQDKQITSDSYEADHLKVIKQGLQALGYGKDVNVTNGKWGSTFSDAIKKFKKDNGLSSTSGTVVGKTFLDALYRRLIGLPVGAMGVAGFSQGGIVKELNKVAADNKDDAWTTVKRGEAIFTPVQTRVFTKEFMPNMNNMIDASKQLSSMIPKVTRNQNISGDTVQASYTFNLENCNNASDMIKQIKTDKNIQNALMDVTVGRSMKKSNLGINKY